MSHWYDRTGKPVYTLIGANGKERDTTLRDAKKLKLLASVTTIPGQLDKSQLCIWQQKQLLETVRKHSYLIGKTDSWKEQLIGISNKENSKYATMGNAIHNCLEEYFKTSNLNPEYEDYVWPFIEYFNTTIREDCTSNYILQPEQSIACKEGFGGKIDLIFKQNVNSDLYIIDYKTKAVDDLTNYKLYDDYIMQLAAYRQYYVGSQTPKIHCLNVLISTTNIGHFHVHEWSEKELDRGWEMFYNLLKFWQIKNNYDSSFEDNNE